MSQHTAQTLIARLSEHGFGTRYSANTVGREWVYAQRGEFQVTAVWYLVSTPPEKDGPGSGQFCAAHLTWGREKRRYTTPEALLEALDLPVAVAPR